MKPVVVVGSINMDLVATAPRIPAPGETIMGQDFAVHPGGKGANQAVAVARLGYPVSMIGRLGDDGFGAQLRDHLTRAGVDLAGVKTSPGTSGVAIIVVSATGENCIVVTPGANALLTPQDLEDSIEIIRSAAVVLTQLETPLETVLYLIELCQREGVPLVLDPAPARTFPQEIFSKIAWFTPNETEASFYASTQSDCGEEDIVATAQNLLGQGLPGVVLKLGSRGAYLATADGQPHRLPPFHVQAVDTTAAGDAFNGAFATGLALHKTPAASAHFATVAAALSVTRFGAQPSMPSESEVLDLFAGSDTTHISTREMLL